MNIEYRCQCGAHISLPAAAAGKRARCKTCSLIFTVPAAGRVAKTEPQIEQEAKPGFLRRLYEGVPPDENESQNNLLPTQSDHPGFWMDLISSFWFFIFPTNLATLVAIVFANICIILLQSFLGLIALIATVLLQGYLFAFYMSTILETASGEDELPTVWVHNITDDLLGPLIQFVGSFLWVLLPAGVLAMARAYAYPDVPWMWIKILAIIGLLHWPAVILAVSIGGGFKGLWPHVVIRTALVAPFAYMAVCVAVLISYGLMILPDSQPVQSATARLNPVLRLAVPLISTVIRVYAMIVTMRVIGLYYRHYKSRFPWTAE